MVAWNANWMTETLCISPDDIRTAFSAAMSEMYRDEVPAYGALIKLVAEVNEATLAADPALLYHLEATDSLARISEERHGAIRLGTPGELSMMRRAFAIMGMFPVGYYDLSTSGVPVHSTAFRPISDESLKRNPFRVFTSLLRLDLIADERLRAEAASVLAERKIFTDNAVLLIAKAERGGGLGAADAEKFVRELLETFRWHDKAIIEKQMYGRLHDAHRLIADVVSFKGPHINHLTPRTLDIDAVQEKMPDHNIAPKAVIEGPPTRNCPILLRQTSFKALEEPVSFQSADGTWKSGSHTARFGEIEQRGVALTPKGRALYDKLLSETRALVHPTADGSNAPAYVAKLSEVFAAFPDDWAGIRQAGLGYFRYSLTTKRRNSIRRCITLETAISEGLMTFDPIVYEDFLPVSAAGIFQSNLGDHATQEFTTTGNRIRFERDLGATVLDEFVHYSEIEQASIESCLALINNAVAAE